MAQEVTKWEDEEGNLHDTEDEANRADAWIIVRNVIDQAIADGFGDLDMQSILANRAGLITALEGMA